MPCAINSVCLCESEGGRERGMKEKSNEEESLFITLFLLSVCVSVFSQQKKYDLFTLCVCGSNICSTAYFLRQFS